MYHVNPYGILASIYRHTYLVEELPKSGCDYIWKLLFAILVLPITWTVIAYNTYHKKITKYENYDYQSKESTLKYDVSYSSEKPIFGAFWSVLLIFAGVITFAAGSKIGFFPEKLYFISNKNYPLAFASLYFMGIAGCVFVSLLAIGLFQGLMWVLRQIPDKEPDYEAERLKREKRANRKPNFFQLLWIGFKAYKEKNCPMLIWDYKKTKLDD